MLTIAPKVKVLSVLAKAYSKIEIKLFHRVLFHIQSTVCLKYFGQDCLCKKYFASNLQSYLFKFDLFNSFGNSKEFNTVLT